MREAALRNRHMKDAERWSEHTKRLPPLTVGNHVRIQNQTGPYPTKWDKTGVVIEVRQFDQYVIRVDGSGRMTTRNRKFLRKYIPVQSTPPRRTLDEDLRHLATLPPRPTTPTSSSPSLLELQPPSSEQPQGHPPHAVIVPEHTSPSQQRCAPSPPPPIHNTPSSHTATPLVPASPSTPPIPDTPPFPNMDLLVPSGPGTPPARPKKPALALRRLQDYNAKGLLEQWLTKEYYLGLWNI